MTHAELIELVAAESGESKAQVGRILDSLTMHMRLALADREEVKLKDLGTFKYVQRAARLARNPQTGEQVEIPAREVIKFRPVRALKEAGSE